VWWGDGFGTQEEDAAPLRALEWLAGHLDPQHAPKILFPSAAGSMPLVNASATRKHLSSVIVSGYLLALYPEEAHVSFRRSIDQRIDDFVRAPACTPQDSWNHGLALLYLAERNLRGEANQPLIETLVSKLVRSQNAEGGWGHKEQGARETYPTTLVALTGWSLLGLGLAERLGVEVDKTAVEKGWALCQEVQSPTGAFPYGGPPYRKGFEAGRTGTVVAALAAWGRTQGVSFQRAVEFLLCNAQSVPRGHASPAMHLLSGALAFRLLGDETWSAYEQAVLELVRKKQQEDGTFGDLLGHSPDSWTGLGDESLNSAYMTAFYAASLATPHSRVAALLCTPVDAKIPIEAIPSPEVPSCLWTAPVGESSRLVASPTHLVAGTSSGAFTVLEAKGGKALARIGEEHEGAYCESLELTKEGLLTCMRRQASGKTEWFLSSRALPDGSLRWEALLPGKPLGWAYTTDQVYTLTTRGEVVSASLKDGSEVLRLNGLPVSSTNRAFTVSPEGEIAVAADNRLVILDAKGTERWSHTGEDRPGPVAPSCYGALVWWMERLLTGETDGGVACYAPDGKLLWGVELGGAIALLRRGTEQILALLDDGQVVALSSKGEIAWRYTPVAPLSSGDTSLFLLDGELVWVHSSEFTGLVGLQIRTGDAVATLPLPKQAPWYAAGGTVFVGGSEGVRAYR
jgi:hypothetical protein